MSTNGIKTSFWGPHAWAFLFSSIAGAYPVRYNPRNEAHVKIMKSFQSLVNSLRLTLPCVYCRESYSRFIKEIPMTAYAQSRRDMMKWLYLIHDQVNLKLMQQERECFEKEKAKLMAMKITPDRLKATLKKLKSQTMTTRPSPSFEQVLAMYERQRAGCSRRTKRCS